jgi:hypothetical protein
VTINPVTGDFSGWAWNDTIGWISFNCGNVAGACVTSSYKVQTTWTAGVGGGNFNWLVSSTYDTCPSGIDCGAALNAITWQGSYPAGARVKFQIATDCLVGGPPPNCDAWNFLGQTSSNDFYDIGWNTPIGINPLHHVNKRYFKYKIFLEPNTGQGADSPEVEDVIINWSP